MRGDLGGLEGRTREGFGGDRGMPRGDRCSGIGTGLMGT